MDICVVLNESREACRRNFECVITCKKIKGTDILIMHWNCCYTAAYGRNSTKTGSTLFLPKHKHKKFSHKMIVHANAQFQAIEYFAWMKHDMWKKFMFEFSRNSVDPVLVELQPYAAVYLICFFFFCVCVLCWLHTMKKMACFIFMQNTKRKNWKKKTKKNPSKSMTKYKQIDSHPTLLDNS